MPYHHYLACTSARVWGQSKTILLKEAGLNRFSLIHITLIFTQCPANVCINTAQRPKYDVEAWTRVFFLILYLVVSVAVDLCPKTSNTAVHCAASQTQGVS